MVISDPTTAAKLTALITKHQPSPTVAIMMPATAGPTARAALIRVELRLTAFRRSSGPTISITKACREGFSKHWLRPSSSARISTSTKVTRLVRVRMPSASAWTPISDCSTTIRRRLSTRSATRPPYGPSSSTGSVCNAITIPSAAAEWVSCSTSQACAVDCIQVPTSEIAWPVK